MAVVDKWLLWTGGCCRQVTTIDKWCCSYLDGSYRQMATVDKWCCDKNNCGSYQKDIKTCINSNFCEFVFRGSFPTTKPHFYPSKTPIVYLTDSLFRGCKHILKKFPHLLNVRKLDGFGPLHLASLNGHFECAKYIIEQERCDIDAITFQGETALHKAIINGHVGVAELLVGHGIDLDVLNENGHSALHLAVTLSRHSNDKDASFRSVHLCEIKKICSTFSDLSGSVGLAGVACLLVREGADLYCMAELGSTPLQLCSDDLALHLTRYAGERSTFHGSLRKSPKPTPADLVEEEDTPKPQKTEEESSRPTDEHESVEQQKTSTHQSTVNSEDGTSFNSTSTVEDTTMLEHPRTEMGPSDNPEIKPTKRSIPVTKPTDTPLPQTTSPSQQPPDDDEACLLCDRPVDVRIEPCGHTVLCRSHANTAKRCPQCRGPIHSIADPEPLCGMCQESVCSVTLKPCDHMMCSACALLMKRCFECKTKITSKIGLDEAKAPAVKSKNDPTSITTTDSNVSISDESLLCEICVSNKKNTAFTCGHQLCYDCSLKVDKCPICREEIKFRIKLH